MTLAILGTLAGSTQAQTVQDLQQALAQAQKAAADAQKAAQQAQDALASIQKAMTTQVQASAPGPAGS
jgi:Flp pilus assembly protein TadG